MDPSPEETRRVVEDILLRTGVTPSELARRVGLAPSTLTRFLNSPGGRTTLSRRSLNRLAAYAPPGALPEPPPRARAEPAQAELADARAPIPYRAAMPRDVPVLRTARGANGEGAFDLNQTGGVVDRVLRGPGIAHSVGVFAIYVEGESMEPRHRPGELRYCDPNRPCRIGDDVVIVLDPAEPGRPPQAFLKELVRRTASEIVTRQSNPEREVRFPADRVRQMIRVLTLNEVMGV